MIVFEKLRYKNFMSTGSQFTEIQLNRSPTTLIIGTNGSGKSSGILDGLCFVLFNKPFRNINKPQIVNSINKKDCLVEVEFTIGEKRYLVRRGIKPTVFEIYLNDHLVNQDAASRDYQQYLEEHVLKMNFKSFTQIVILGSSSYVPFMQLTAASRREIIDNLLDINIFSLMNQILKTKMSDNKEAMRVVDGELQVIKTKVELQKKYIDTLQNDGEKKKQTLIASIEKVKRELESISLSVDKKNLEIGSLTDSLVNKSSLQSEIKKTKSELIELSRDKITLTKELTFFQENDTCNTCNQYITIDHKNQHISKYKSKLVVIEESIDILTKQLKELEVRYTFEVDDVEAEIDNKKIEFSTLVNRLNAGNQYLDKLVDDLSKLDDVVRIDTEKETLKNMAKDAVAISKKRNELIDEKQYLDVAVIMLKDSGIKTKIIKQYIPVINKLINKYLSAFDFFVSFELDENFNEVIRSRYRDEFSYESFSEGEKEKINLAILFTWREIAKLKNSSSTNLLICDEVLDGSLDAVSLDNLLEIFCNQKDTNLFVISHSPDNYFDKFRSIIKFEKMNNYSVIV